MVFRHVVLMTCMLSVAVSTSAAAKPFLPIGRDPDAAPPMDDPPLPWFNYWLDGLGRPTYLPADCLFSDDKDFVDRCVPQAIIDHRAWVAKHERDAAIERQREDYRQQLVNKQNEKRAAEAKRRADELSRQQEAAERDARAAAYREAHDPVPYARKIHDLKSKLAYYRRQMAREDRIGNVSGYVNVRTKHQLGEMIVDAEDRIAADYQKYLDRGGKKPLSAL